MMAFNRAEVLERRIDLHVKRHNDEIRCIKNELQNLKVKPKSVRDQRPDNDGMQKSALNSKTDNVRKLPAKSLKKFPAIVDKGSSLNNNLAGDKMTNKMILQHHPCDDEHIKMKNDLARTESLHTLDTLSTVRTTSMADTVMSKINYNGEIVPAPVRPLKLLQFLIMELKTKLKDYIPEDDIQVPKMLKEINYAIKQAIVESKLNGSMKNQTSDVEGNRTENGKTYTSKDIQTNLYGDEVEKLQDFQSKYLLKQLDLDTNLRRLEEMFTVELRKSDEKIGKLSHEINLLQSKFKDEINDTVMEVSKRMHLKIEEITGEMKFLVDMIEETKNHNLIDNMNKKLAQTQKKIDAVKRKCTETAKHCLQMQVEKHLIDTHAVKTKRIGSELGQIKNEVRRGIRELKDAVSRNDLVQQQQYQSSIELNSTASSFTSDCSLLTPPIPLATESIKSSAKLNEKMSKMKRYDDKFSSKIDDEKDNESILSARV